MFKGSHLHEQEKAGRTSLLHLRFQAVAHRYNQCNMDRVILLALQAKVIFWAVQKEG